MLAAIICNYESGNRYRLSFQSDLFIPFYLCQDNYMFSSVTEVVSQMDSDQYVLIQIVANFNQVCSKSCRGYISLSQICYLRKFGKEEYMHEVLVMKYIELSLSMLV